MCKRKTYKQKVLDTILREKGIIEGKWTKVNKELRNRQITNTDMDLISIYSKQRSILNDVYSKCKQLPTSVFTPTRFPTAVFLSIKLSIPDIIDKIYNK